MNTGLCHSNSLQQPETRSAESTVQPESVLNENFSAGTFGAESAYDALLSEEKRELMCEGRRGLNRSGLFRGQR